MTPQVATSIPYVDLVTQHAALREEVLAAVARVLDHGQFVFGPEVAQLEERWARQCDVAHAVGVSNGTAGLFLILKALGIGPGDEVITPPNSFLASTSSIVHADATPRFADVGDDFNIDPDSVRRAITPRTRAIIAVHLTGRPADMDALVALAEEHGLDVIEDAAQAIGATCKGRSVGGLGRAACFSLHPLKTVGACGDGGIITTNDDELADRLRLLRNHGLTRRQEDCTEWGYNARLDTIQAAVALVKIERLEEWTACRREHATIYRERLGDGGVGEGNASAALGGPSAGMSIPTDRPEDRAVYHTFSIEVDRRDELVEHLTSAGVGCAVHYRVPIHLLDVARELGYSRGDLPVAERQADRVVSLPIHEGLGADRIHTVCDRILEFQC